MTITDAVILGLVQGSTEFLPVSSSGHLVLAEGFLKVKSSGITFEVLVHFGTFLSVITVLRRRVWQVARAVLGGIRALFRGDLRARLQSDADLTLALSIALGTIPAGAIGVAFEEAIESAFSNPALTAGCLLITGAILWSTRYAKPRGRPVGYADALTIGIAQAVAILPGVSRSGSTISVGLWRGISGPDAAEFSFMLSLPVILGATVLKVGKVLPLLDAWKTLLVGTIVAYLSGCVAIWALLGLLRRGRLVPFAYYCWAAGIAGVVFFALK